MSRVRYAVRCAAGQLTPTYCNKFAHARAKEIGGKALRITCFDAAETKARRAVIEAAKGWCAHPTNEFWRGLLVHAVQALERKGAGR